MPKGVELNLDEVLRRMSTQGLKQGDLADKAGIDLRTIQRTLKGETNPSHDTALLIATALGLRPDQFSQILSALGPSPRPSTGRDGLTSWARTPRAGPGVCG